MGNKKSVTKKDKIHIIHPAGYEMYPVKLELEDILKLCKAVDNIVDYVCKKADIEKYKSYKGNHCIQTALAINYVFKKLFEGTLGDFKIHYGIMIEEGEEKYYNHAYFSFKDLLDN